MYRWNESFQQQQQQCNQQQHQEMGYQPIGHTPDKKSRKIAGQGAKICHQTQVATCRRVYNSHREDVSKIRQRRS